MRDRVYNSFSLWFKTFKQNLLPAISEAWKPWLSNRHSKFWIVKIGKSFMLKIETPYSIGLTRFC